MVLRQLLLRFWVTDHGYWHFREESLTKIACSHLQQARTSSAYLVNLVILDLLSLQGRAARCIPAHILQLDWFCFENSPNGCHVSFN
jgi:hypothetical protein